MNEKLRFDNEELRKTLYEVDNVLRVAWEE